MTGVKGRYRVDLTVSLKSAFAAAAAAMQVRTTPAPATTRGRTCKTRWSRHSMPVCRNWDFSWSGARQPSRHWSLIA